MSNPRKIALNTLQLSICRIGGLIVQSIAFIIIARYLGKNGLGRYSVVFAYLSFFQIITGQGIDALVIKELSNSDQHPAIIGNAIILKLLAGVVAVALSVLVLQFLGFDPEVKKYIYVASLSLMFGFSSIFASLFQHHMKTLYYSLPEMFVALLTAVAMAILAAIGAPVLSLVVINGFSIVMTTVIYWTLCVNKLHLRPIFVFDPVLSKKILQSAWPILFAGLFVAINTRVDQLILYRLKGDAEVGAYSAAVKFTELLSFIPVAFTTVIFPFMCDSYNSSKEKFVFVYRRSFKYMAIIIIPVAIGTSILAEPIVNLVYGTKFHGSATILAVLIWSQIFVFMGCVNGNMLIIMNLQKILFSLTLVAAVTNILLNLWLIPTYSGLGAAIATVISYGCVGILIQGTLRQTRPIMLDYLGATIKPIIASVIMGLVIYNLSTIHLMMDIFIGMITYVTSIFLIKGVDSVDSGYVRQILYRQRGVRVIE